MKKRLKIKKTLALVLALCLITAYFPLQASAEDGTVEITNWESWENLMETVSDGWPNEIVFNLPGGIATGFTINEYVKSNITVRGGIVILDYGMSGSVKVEGGGFSFNGKGNPLSQVTVTGGEFANKHAVTGAEVSGGAFANNAGCTVVLGD